MIDMEMHSKSGQSMIEFLMGLVGIMVIVLGLELIVQVVDEDLENLFDARETVAEDLIGWKPDDQGSYPGDLPVDPYAVYDGMQGAVDHEGNYSEFRDLYPSGEDRADRLKEVWNGSDPLRNMVGSSPMPRTIPISSPFLQQSIGRSSIKIDNVVYMPPWDDLM